MESFHSMFGKQNRVAQVFIWFKSRIEQNHFILCLDCKSYECGGERQKSARVQESARIRSFWWSGSISTIYGIYFHMKTLGAASLHFH
jgi:hypothetical protein